MMDRPPWRCAECKHFKSSEQRARPFGGCRRWHADYDYIDLKLDECQVEIDEGWGAIVGPDFGCVLWEAKECATSPKP